uniref:Ovule protein n=1 Tax=Brugia timori TaxID=42155 RepID=A0A0R3Q6J4_9BILA
LLQSEDQFQLSIFHHINRSFLVIHSSTSDFSWHVPPCVFDIP